MNEEDVFKYQSELIRRAAGILADIGSELENTAKTASYKTHWEEQREVLVQVFEVRSLKIFERHLLYIADKILDKEKDKYIFLIPQVRTLLDAHAHFIHLLDNDMNKRALICLTYQLLTCTTLGESTRYEMSIKNVSDFLEHIRFKFPEEMQNFSKNWCKKHQLGWPNKSTFLTIKNIGKYSSSVINVFAPESVGEIYSMLSEYIHGNPYYFGDPSNERFWVIAVSIFTSAFVMEISDRYLLEKTNRKIFRQWLSDVNDSKTYFANLWKTQRIQPVT